MKYTSKLILNWETYQFGKEEMTKTITKLMLNWQEYETREYQQWWWKPGANTVLYLPMDTDLLDHSLSPKTITNNWGVSLVSNIGWATIDVAQFNSSSKSLGFTNNYPFSWAWTILAWFKSPLNNTVITFISSWTTTAKEVISLCYQSSAARWLSVSNYDTDVDVWNTTWRDNTWHLVTATYTWIAGDTNNVKIYIDGVQLKQGTSSWWEITNNASYIWNYQTYDNFNWYMSKFILESKTRTEQEISDYFNQTKWGYWIS